MRIRNRYDADVPMVVGPVARRAPGLRRGRALPARRDRAQGQVHAARPDDHGRHAVRRPLQSREKLAWAFAEILNEEARAIAATGVDVIQFDEPAFNVYFDEVARLGRRRARARRRRACRARPPCTSATATASRPTSTGRRRWAREWRQYEQTFPLLAAVEDRPGLARMRELARADRAASACSRGKDVLVGAIDVASETVETPEEVAATIRAALTFVPAGAALPLHQLRHGAAAARRRARQARGAGRRRGAGPPRTRLTRAAWLRYRDAGKKARESPKPSRAPTDQAADGVTARCRCRCRSC